VELAAVFASAGDPASRPTILFLHGKGGEASEWQPDALRAVALGYNVLVPELRGHPPSGGEFITFGLLEKEDLACLVETAAARFGIDPARLGVHSCSAGSTIALEFAAERDAVRALWLESPYADPAGMARHYLALATGLPEWLLGLTAHWAVELAVVRVARALSLDPAAAERDKVDPVGSARRVRGRVCMVYGETDRLVPPRFPRALVPALPPGSIVWAAPAGHCHHADEPQKMLQAEYLRRWTAFFGENLPVRQKDVGRRT
jgi:pimeloyl-ACP methyl ester carboxylesterase